MRILNNRFLYYFGTFKYIADTFIFCENKASNKESWN